MIPDVLNILPIMLLYYEINDISLILFYISLIRVVKLKRVVEEF
jgi:hypothetical protein